MPAQAAQMSVAEHDAVVLAFWGERFPEMAEVSVTVRDAAGRVVGYRLVPRGGCAAELTPSAIDGVLSDA